MRVLVSAVLVLWLSLCDDAWGSGCALEKSEQDASAGRLYCSFDEDQASEPASSDPYSTFRGIGLASQPEYVQRIGRSFGYEVDVSTFVGDDTIAAISFYENCQLVGQFSFDRRGHMLRLSLKDRFFCNRDIFVRRFAEALFKRYAVTPAKVDDDVCFQDVTCFKGVSKYGERFLILRIGTEADLYVRR
jgi:hypothetical protein